MATLAQPPARFALTLPINAALETNAKTFQYPYEFGIAGRGAYDYTWIYVLGIIFSFLMAAAVRLSSLARLDDRDEGGGRRPTNANTNTTERRVRRPARGDQPQLTDN